MDKIKAFSDARGFQTIFGIQEHDNGVKSRRNKILLQFYKSRSMWQYCKKKGYKNGYYRYFSISSMADLKAYILNDIRHELEMEARIGVCVCRPVILMGDVYWSKNYSTDSNEGIPSNGDANFVRYVTHEEKRDGKVYRMKSGRFFKRIMLESELGRSLPEQVLNWLCEEFTMQWASYVTRQLPHLTLHVDDDFRRIYSYGLIEDGIYGCTTDFGSCMMDDGQHVFYENSVKAKAAYLTNDQNRVIARCIIFTDVYDDNGKKWRLAERQYAQCGRDLYKRCLVDALIDGGFIDGYKQVGVDCHQTTSYVDVNGKSLSDVRFHIECNLEFSGDEDDAWDNEDCFTILSYQDSFKFYKYKDRIAYNSEPDDFKGVVMLDTTSSYLEGSWDNYHERWCASTRCVWKNGCDYSCDCDDLDEFIRFNRSYIHKNDFVKCPVCGNIMPNPELYKRFDFMIYFNDGNETSYVCSSECRRKLQDEFDKISYYDSVAGKTRRSDIDEPILFLHLFGGDVEIYKCSSKHLMNYIENNKIYIAKCPDGSLVPMYYNARWNPQQRFNDYLESYPRTMKIYIDEVIKANEKLYHLYSEQQITQQ